MSTIEPWLREILRCPSAGPSCATTPVRTGRSWSAPTPSAAWRIASTTAYRSCSSTRPDAPNDSTMTWLDEARLDDVAALEALDRKEALRSLATSGAQVRRSLLAAREAGIDSGARRTDLAQCSSRRSAAPRSSRTSWTCWPSHISGARHDAPPAPLPGWVGPLDLVIAVSQSGRAAGPLALAHEAARRGAQLLTIGAADSPLADVCAGARGTHVDLVSAASSTRTALWSLLTRPCMPRGAWVWSRSARRSSVGGDIARGQSRGMPTVERILRQSGHLAMVFSGVILIVLADGPLAGSPGVDWRPAWPGLPGSPRRMARCPMLPRKSSRFDGPLAGAGRFWSPHADRTRTSSLTLPRRPGDAAAQPVARAGRVARSVTAHPRRGRSRQPGHSGGRVCSRRRCEGARDRGERRSLIGPACFADVAG